MRLPFLHPRPRAPRRPGFDRFTDRARRVLALAQLEAQLLRHNHIGSEHLLLGLVREHDGVAAKVLANLGVESQKLRSAVEILTGRGATEVLGEIPLTPDGKKAIELSVNEAKRLNHNYIGTEHLLLGVTRADGIAAGVLGALGVSAEVARVEIVRILSQSMRENSDPLDEPASIDSAEIRALLCDLETTIKAKDNAIAVQDYERAAMLRDRELKLRLEVSRLRDM